MAGIWRPAGNDRRLVSVGPAQLMFLGDALEGFRDALDAVGQPVIVLDRQRTDDLVFATRGRRRLPRIKIQRGIAFERVDARNAQVAENAVQRADHRELEEGMLLALHVADELLAVFLAPREVGREKAVD